MATQVGAVLMLAALLLIIGAGVEGARTCKDGWDQPGLCVSLPSCTSLRRLVEGVRRLSSDQATRIRASICDRQPLLVCCALPKRDPTTTTTTTTTPAPLDLSQFDPNTPEGNPKRLLLPTQCGLVFTERIVGGEEAGIGEHPWLALLGYKDTANTDYYYYDYYNEGETSQPEEIKIKFSCGGVLINERYVITAAHCIPKPGDGQLLKIRLGEHNLKTEVDCQVSEFSNQTTICNEPPVDVEPERILSHPQYNRPWRKMNDIALIRLKTAVNFTNWVRPICLPFGEMRTGQLPKDEAIVAGFGLTEAFGDTSPSLQELKVPLVSLAECGALFSKKGARLGSTQMCAGGVIGQDSCEGDSGGPLIMHERYGPPYYLIGVTSFGTTQCGKEAIPGVYTKVSEYLDWILQNIAP